MAYSLQQYLDEIVSGHLYLPLETLTTAGLGAYVSYWAGATPPAAGRACDTTLDGVRIPASPASTFRIGRLRAQFINLFFFDRLCDNSGLAMNSTGSQASTLPALPRYTDGFLVEAFLEINTAVATIAATNLTVNYTNQAGASKTSVTSLAANWTTPAKRMHPIVLAAGDTGVRSIQSVQLDTAAATAGDFGLVLARRLALLTNQGASLYTNEWNAFRGGLPKVLPNACLFMAGITSATTTPAPVLEYMLVRQ